MKDSIPLITGDSELGSSRLYDHEIPLSGGLRDSTYLGGINDNVNLYLSKTLNASRRLYLEFQCAGDDRGVTLTLTLTLALTLTLTLSQQIMIEVENFEITL